MRNKLIALMFAAALPTLALAAPEKGAPDMPPPPAGMHQGPGMHHRGGSDMFDKLDLSREQRQQIGKLMGQEMKARRDITQQYLHKLPAAEQKAMQDQIKASEEKSRANVRAVLKPEQQKQFDEMKKKQDERRAEWAQFQTWKAEHGKKAQ